MTSNTQWAIDDYPYEKMVARSGLQYGRAHLGLIFELDGLYARGLFQVSELSDNRLSIHINRIATPYQAKRILSLAFYEGRL